ncbi:hypothetical protein [Streptomyces sp. A 4/2]|uniref:hypothetical protein n=1 Tax=Streptomyces sp. A 4/2 TaxID=2934314 RepID=UPI0020255136|nr:hypothetical protein [Streptomyces sp. A 4/2]
MNIEHSAETAEQMRADLADFFGKPVRGLPVALDFIQAMHLSRTSKDIGDNRRAVELHRDWVLEMAKNLEQAQVWVASPSLTSAITDHELVTSPDGYLLENTDEAPAPVGVVHFPVPITAASELPIYGLAWESEGSGDQLQLSVTALTSTPDLYEALPPPLLPSHWARSPYAPNAMVLAVPQISTKIQGYGHHPHWGAAPASILVGLLLAFWSLRPAFEHDEQTVARKTGKGRKLRVKFRPVRVIREVATRFTGEHVPAEHDRRWADETLRWSVDARWSWRCSNPRDHKAIVEAGGTCPKIKVRVKAHVNGPKGRGLDTRRTARISTISTRAAGA